MINLNRKIHNYIVLAAVCCPNSLMQEFTSVATLSPLSLMFTSPAASSHPSHLSLLSQTQEKAYPHALQLPDARVYKCRYSFNPRGYFCSSLPLIYISFHQSKCQCVPMPSNSCMQELVSILTLYIIPFSPGYHCSRFPLICIFFHNPKRSRNVNAFCTCSVQLTNARVDTFPHTLIH